MAFDFINFQQETVDFGKIIVSPDLSYTRINGRHIQIALSWCGEEVKFDSENAVLLPTDKKGIYSFIVQPGIVGSSFICIPFIRWDD